MFFGFRIRSSFGQRKLNVRTMSLASWQFVYLSSCVFTAVAAVTSPLSAQNLTDGAQDCLVAEIANAGIGNLTFDSSTAVKDFSECRGLRWILGSSPGRRLWITFDSVQVPGNASIQVEIDGVRTVIDDSCDRCPASFSRTGRVVRVTYYFPEVVPVNHTLTASEDGADNTSVSDGFFVRYVDFDPDECEAPPHPVNGVAVVSDRKLGSQVRYKCNVPYVVSDKTTAASVSAFCVHKSESPVPTWSEEAPVCRLPDCGSKTPIRLNLDDENPVTIMHPGYPNSLDLNTKDCTWEIVSSRKKHLFIQVADVKLPNWSKSKLELYDGKVNDRRLLVQFTMRSSSQQNFTTVFSKAILIFRAAALTEGLNDPIDDYGFTVHASSKTPPCEIPLAPINGDVKGSKISSANAKVSFEVLFSCFRGYRLVGAEHAVCSRNGKWSPSSLPKCTVAPANVSDVAAAEDGDPGLPEKSLTKLRTSKNRRPQPQDAEEKTDVKPDKDSGTTVTKQHPSQVARPAAEEGQQPVDSSLSIMTEPEEEGSTSVSTSAFPEDIVFDFNIPDRPFENMDEMFPDESREEDEAETYEEMFTDDGGKPAFPVMAIILGVGIPLLLGMVAIGGCLVYRRLYPVRMSIGRKFDTFENPVYVRGKRGTGTTTGPLLPHASLAQSPAEVQRLTAQASP